MVTPEAIFGGSSEMGALMRSLDWSQTPLGSLETWSQSLRTSISICLSSRFPILLWWGADLVMFYNDAYRPMLGIKHPKSLGQRGQDCWVEIWDVIGPMLEGVLTTGEATWSENQLLLLDRHGYIEECYFTFSYSPIADETGGIGGVFTAVTETTRQVIGARRLQTLRDLAANSAQAKTVEEAYQAAIAALANNPGCIPFALLYRMAPNDQAHLVGMTGLEAGTIASPAVVDLSQAQLWPFEPVKSTGQPQHVENLQARFGELFDNNGVTIANDAILLPLTQAGDKQRVIGFLVLGISPKLAFDSDYQSFFDLVTGNVETAIANVEAYEAERQRAEALAELDRAKTTFFSNVSHEFRTPLTLMLSPLEELSNTLNGQLQPDQREQLQLVQRNGLRLQKLVNTLLDFSRIEAGRIQASYKPTDLAAYTVELASVFRSLIEQADMTLVIDCPALPEPVYIDRDMWEKIVLNLLSNAFKFTFTGSITVRLQPVGSSIELSVTDTGVGIPEAELPRLFERFHRVSGTRSRTYEGSGIGLALVQELVTLHGGTIQVTSHVDRGTTFTIAIPFGTAHLPHDRIAATRTLASTALGANSYVAEASRWISDPAIEGSESRDTELSIAVPTQSKPSSTLPARVLLVDDNADMRDYVKRVLSQYWAVETVSDGFAALSAIAQCPPDLVLSDVMMPGLDGFGLLRELRTNPRTKEIPMILLSARAGEESRIEGLEAGADDYLTKPFSARELLARVESTLKLAQLRHQAESARQQVETILSSIQDGFYVLDRNWHFAYVSDRLCDMAGKSRAELLGHNNWELFPEAVDTEVYIQFHRSLREQIPLQFEYLYLPWNRWFEYRVYPSADGLTIFATEVTDRKRAEAQLHESETFLQAINETAPNLLYIFDLNERRNVYVSPQIFPMLGLSPVDVQAFDSQLLVELFHPDDLEQIEQHHDRIRAAREDDIFTIEYRMKHASGKWLWLSSRDKIFARDQQGNPTQILGSAIDITDRKRTEEVLRESLAILNTVNEVTPTLIYIKDQQRRLQMVNPATARLLGKSEAELIGKTEVDYLRSEEAEQIAENDRRVMESGQVITFEELVVVPEGNRIFLSAKAPYRNEQGNIIGLIGVSTDITDRKQAEATLQESERRFRRLAESSMFGVAFGNFAGGFHYANDYFLNMIGYTRAEIETEQVKWMDITPPEFLPLDEQAAAELRTKGVSTPFEKEYIRKDGTRVPILIGSALLQEPYDQRQDIISFYVDLSDRKQAELALRESEAIARTRAEELETLMGVVPVGIWLAHDPDCRQVTVNRAAYRLMRAEPGDPTTATPADDIYPFKFKLQRNGQDIPAEELSLQKAGRTGQEVVEEVELVFEDGVVHYMYGRAVPLRNEAGNVRGAIGAYVDISDRKHAEAEREQLLAREQAAREEAERANRIKDEFLAVLSHELRSPLNPILGWSRLLQTGKLDEAKTKQALATIERNAKLQSELIEDLLDVSRILRGKLNLTVSPINLASTIRAAIETVRLAAEAKSIAIETELDPAAGLVSGDATRLQQIVWNLLSNAVKFTPSGGQVTVQLEHVNDHAQITIRDTGQGISPDFLPYVFDYFRQADSATTRKFGGLGLGLAIVRHLVELHGGTVGVASPGERQGATFTVRLPLMSTPLNENLDDRSPQRFLDFNGIKILIVDDEPDTRELVAFILEQQGAQVIAATSAHEALLILPQAKPDILLSDIGMPEMDGYMLIQQVRQLAPKQGGQIPAIALTAYAGDMNQQQALAAGFQKHISKPIEPEKLIYLISSLVTRGL